MTDPTARAVCRFVVTLLAMFAVYGWLAELFPAASWFGTALLLALCAVGGLVMLEAISGPARHG